MFVCFSCGADFPKRLVSLGSEFWKFCTTDSWTALCESNTYYCSQTSVIVGQWPEIRGPLDVPIASLLTIRLPALPGYSQTPRAPSHLSGL